MTENEEIKKVINELNFLKEKLYNGIYADRLDCIDYAISALEEIQQYREIGTVKEFREAVEKQKAKKHGTGGHANGMGDLISRKSMIDILKGVDQEGLLTICQIIEFIEDRPSTFDKEKVIKELQHASNVSRVQWKRYDDSGAFHEMRAFESAIEIVERGGI